MVIVKRDYPRRLISSPWKKTFRSYLCLQIIRGALIQRAEIIPIRPDPGNAGEGK